MRHFNYTLTPKAIDAAKPKDKAYSLTDGGGLILDVLPSGTKAWRYKYHLAGKREKVTLGNYPALTLKAARERHEEMRLQVAKGESPAAAKRETAVEQKVATAGAVTFRDFAQTWIRETLFHRSATYRAQIVRWLDAHVYPAIGDKELAGVQPADVLPIIEALRKYPTTADRVRVIIQQIYNYAIRKLILTTNPAAAFRGLVVVPPKTHHKHLLEPQLAAFWRELDRQGCHATTTFAAKLLFLTMVRKGELIKSRWREFDLDAAIWDIPGERMKMGRPHRVYLSTQAVELLRMTKALTGDAGPDGYVFPTIFRRSTHMAEVTLNHLFGRMDFGVSGFSPHGARGTAATMLREHGWPKDVVELLLAHAEDDKTAASYSHHELPEERRKALQWLADRIDRLAAGAQVVPLRA